MIRITRAASRRVEYHASDVAKGRQKRDPHQDVIKTEASTQNVAMPSIKKESKSKVKKITDRLNAIKTQSISQMHKSATDSCNQDSSAEVTTEKKPVSLDNYFLDNERDDPNCVQEKVESISDIEQFKTDETPVAVPIHGPSTPHRINMPLEDLNGETATESQKKQSVMAALRGSLQVIKKPSSRGRKGAVANNLVNNCRSLKLPSTTSTNHSITDYFPVRRSVRKSKKAVLEEKQRDMENKVICQIEEGLEVRHFPGKGRGVVSTRKFAKGEFVVEYIGELISQVEAKEREKIYAQDQNAGCYMYYFQHRNQQYCVDATAETDKLGRLVNHSRNGNLVARIVEVCSIPHLVLAAKEDIPVGVEVSYDYGDRSRESIRNHPWLAL